MCAPLAVATQRLDLGREPARDAQSLDRLDAADYFQASVIRDSRHGYINILDQERLFVNQPMNDHVMEDAGLSFFTRFQMEFLPPVVRQASFNDKPLFVILVSAYLRGSRMIFFSLRFSEKVHPALSPVSFLYLKCIVDGSHFRFSINTSRTFAENPFPSRDFNLNRPGFSGASVI